MPSMSLAPFEVRRIDVGDLQRRGVIPKEAFWAQVTVATNANPDEVVAVAASYDSTLRFGAQTPFSDQMSAHLEGGEWRFDSTHTSIIAAGSGSSLPVQAAFTIFYDQGRKQYRLEQVIPGDDQWWINIGDLVLNQTPDVNGSVLPSDISAGAYQLREVGDTEQNALYEGKVVTDKTYGHATYGCMICCGYGGGASYFLEDPTGVAVSGTRSLDAYAENACTGNSDNVNQYFINWSTGNASIMTAQLRSVTGIAAGSTSIDGVAPQLPNGDGAESRTGCPRVRSQNTVQGSVGVVPSYETVVVGPRITHNGDLVKGPDGQVVSQIPCYGYSRSYTYQIYGSDTQKFTTPGTQSKETNSTTSSSSSLKLTPTVTVGTLNGLF